MIGKTAGTWYVTKSDKSWNIRQNSSRVKSGSSVVNLDVEDPYLNGLPDPDPYSCIGFLNVG